MMYAYYSCSALNILEDKLISVKKLITISQLVSIILLFCTVYQITYIHMETVR